MKVRNRWLAIAAVMSLAAVLRFAWLGRASYTIDESQLVKIALSYRSISDLVQREFQRFAFLHRLPLTMILLRLCAQTVPWQGPLPPEWVMRLPMALIGLATVGLLYAARLLGDRRVGFWAMLLCAVSFFAVFYSREAYDYSLLIFLSTATLLAAAALLKSTLLNPTRFPVVTAVAYAASSAALLQAHLSGLLFLAPLTGLLGILLLGIDRGRFLRRRSLAAAWAVTLGAPYVLFLPFLLKLLGGGFTVTESDIARRFSPAVIPALWGRMGWGEGLPARLLFGLAWGGGLVCGLTRRDRVYRWPVLLILLQTSAYFALQSWMLRVSRFEIRYYSPLLPGLLLPAALGLAALEHRVKEGRPRLMTRSVMVAALLAWSAPFLWAICRLECRGYANYKGIARWINTRTPEGSTYAFLNLYDLRGVPQTYPTPGRTGTAVAFWSSKEEHLQVRAAERARRLFSQFPTIYFIEIAPRDLLCPEVAEDFIPRKQLFTRSVWLHDPWFDLLTRWKTNPLGDTQYNATNAHRVLISYNLRQDLPRLARNNRRRIYHLFDSGWRYARDRGFNHWIISRGSAKLRLGNVSTGDIRSSVSLLAVGVPRGCLLSVRHDDRWLVRDREIPPSPTAVALPEIILPPGESVLQFDTTATQDAPEAALAIGRVRLGEAGAP